MNADTASLYCTPRLGMGATNPGGRGLPAKQGLLRAPETPTILPMTPVVMIAGDGIGPEVMDATQHVLRAAGAHVDWVEAQAGLDAAERFGDPLPDATLDLVRKYR